MNKMLIAIMLMFFVGHVSAGCDGPYKGKKLTADQIRQIVVRYKEWSSKNNRGLRTTYSYEHADKFPQFTNFCGALMEQINLQGFDLSGFTFREANLWNANLEKAMMSGVDLREADLSSAKFNAAYLVGSDFRGAYLGSTQLKGANLRGANFSQADLSFAILNNADLRGADLNGANIEGVFVNGVIFEPLVETMPGPRGYLAVRGLSEMQYIYSPSALTVLRKNFRDAGYLEKVREITYAIKHTEMLRNWSPHPEYDTDKLGETGILNRVDAIFNYVLFELTTAWGMHPGRAIMFLFGFIPLFSIPYFIVLIKRSDDGIWQEWSPHRKRKDLGQDEPLHLHLGIWNGLWFGIYFSVLSAFHIGWRELNVGNWIARLQRREYTLHATGWVRTISGLQSLISVYLLAMWALTYFGKPFE